MAKPPAFFQLLGVCCAARDPVPRKSINL